MSADKFFEKIELLRCPVCGAAFSQCGASLRCKNGHTFDPSRKGYVNFVPNAAPSHYAKSLFEARRRILGAGFYAGIVDSIRSEMLDAPSVVLDAGCGDGTFTKALQGETTVGLDYAKDAIRLAASGGGPILWTVGDLTNLPLRDSTVDVILNLFSPAHYADFSRVLKPKGKLVKLVPQEGYLREIRTLIGDGLKKSNYSNESVVSHLSERYRLLKRIRVRKTFPLTADQSADFLLMTPLTFDVSPEKLDASALKEITIDTEILIAETE